MSDMTKRFSDGARRIITSALLCAKELGHSYIGSEHLLLGILKEDCVCAKLLTERGVDYLSVKSKLLGIVGTGCRTPLTSDDMTPVCRRIILRASFLANSDSAVSVGIEHMFMALLDEECIAVRIITELGVDVSELQNIVSELFFTLEPKKSQPEPKIRYRKQVSVPTPLLDANAVDLTEKAKKGKVDPVVGRENEEERLIAVLLRRSKNNPCLVGEAGVGKTAIVESVASRIALGKVPKELEGKRIMSLELSSVVAGTKYRGEFEEKIKNILEEVRASENIILFIDEIHTIVGAGGAEGAIDASNILKPALARGEIRVIGATTLDEFRESIERDKALERRFQPINVLEPDEQECIKMLSGIREKYESYHGVSITDEAINAAVKISVRYITERSLPDKAIDLIDEAAAVLKMSNYDKKGLLLGADEIARTAEKKTGIPISMLDSDEKKRLLELETELKKYVIGQDEAIKALCDSVRRARSGLRNGGRPNASFLFIGRAGVGKTECAKALSNAIFANRKAFIRLDMSEFSESHSVSKIIGSPPGYIGFGEGGALTEKVRRNPYSLILFDEVEKCHPDVRALLLQVLDEGALTDSAGVTVRFDNSIIIMTANTGQGGGIGFGSENQSAALTEALKLFAPELVDRVDEIICFKSLSDSSLLEIARSSVSAFCEGALKLGIRVETSEDFYENAVLASNGKSARNVSRTVLRLAEEAISNLILHSKPQKEETAVIFIENGRGIAKIKQNAY